VVWINILRSDDRYSAYLRSTEFDDPRVKYFWDARDITGVEWQETLDIEQLAWDIYFLYGRDAKWEDLPDMPDYWMHQLGNLQERAPFLDGDSLKEKMGEFLKND
jgi:hypothetical protein